MFTFNVKNCIEILKSLSMLPSNIIIIKSLINPIECQIDYIHTLLCAPEICSYVLIHE